MRSIIFIVGPTALGKTDVSYILARKTGAEIISCDSMLIYREPEIITSKPPSYMREEIKHHFAGTLAVTEAYSVFDYCSEATVLISELFKSGKPVIVCGGSGLYVNALLDGIVKAPAKNKDLRNDLLEMASEKGAGYLYMKLKEVDSKTAGRISPNDLKRIIRALEVYYISGAAISDKRRKTKSLWKSFPVKIFGLQAKREIMYERINKRVDLMFSQGAAEEVKKLVEADLSLTAEKIIGIKEINRFLKNECSLDEAKEEMKKNTRNFAKRQVTWFKRDKRINWIDVDGLSPEQIAESIYEAVTQN